MPDIDAEDIERARLAETKALRLVMNALVLIPEPFWGRDRAFIGFVCRMAADQLTERQRQHVQRVAWRLRRYLPPHLAPKCNPDDPIVREMAMKRDAHV